MTKRSRHPAPETWMQFLEGSLDTETTRELETHRAGCPRCNAEVSLLERVHRAADVPRWGAPSAPARRRARRLPAAAAVPKAARPAKTIPITPPDVRGGGYATMGEARMVTRSFSWGELGVLVIPPVGDERWRIEGRVWLRTRSDKPTRVVLIHEDHVLATTEIGNGEPFHFEDVLPPGWRVEVHPPGERPVVLEDPRP